MLVVQQGNKQLRVPDEAKEVYLSMGYSVLDEEGKILEAGQATSLAEIKAENATLKSKLSEYQGTDIETVKAENESLKAELEALKADKKGK